MQKNVTGQKIQVFAFIPSTGLPKTGDAANITAYVSKDHGSVTVLGDTSATEMDSTNAKGVYLFDLTQGETNADELTFTAKSSTSDVSIVPRFISTNPPNFTAASIDSNGRVDVIKIAGTSQTARDIGASVLLSTGTGTGQLDFTSGVVKANATQWLGGTIPAVNVTGVPLVDVKYVLGTIVTSATAGLLDVNVKRFNNVVAVSLPTNFDITSIDASGRVKTQTNVTKNTALAGFTFIMTDSTTHAPKTGLTVTSQRSLNGGAFASTTNSAAEVANGEYTIDLSAADMNANTVMFRFMATGADDLFIEILTTQ